MNDISYENDLLNIYHKTQGGDTIMPNLYTMVNVAMVVNGIRPGGIIQDISEENKKSVVESMRRLGLFVKDIRWNPTGEPILLFVRHDNQLQRNLLASMITTLNRETMPRNNSNLIINKPPAPNNQSHRKLGQLLGYFNTMEIRNLAVYKNSAGIDVIVRHEGIDTPIKVFPQKILDITETKLNVLRTMATEIGNMRLPDGFSIVSSNAFYEIDGVKTVIDSLPNRVNTIHGENDGNAESIIFNSNNTNINHDHGLIRLTGGKRRKRQTRSKRTMRRSRTRSSR